MEYEYKESIKEMIESYVISESEELKMKAELDHVYAQAAKADEYETNLKEVRKQLKIKIRHARQDGDYSEAYTFSEALDMIVNSI